VKVVSVLTSGTAGGAEHAAVRMLDALAGRGHEAVLLTDVAGLTAGSAVAERSVRLGPKLSGRSWPALLAAAPVLRGRLARALGREAPYDLLLLHFKKDQLLAPLLPPALRPRVAWAEWGPLPPALRGGFPGALYRRASAAVAAVAAVSEGTKHSLLQAGAVPGRIEVVPNVVSADRLRPEPEEGRALREQLGIPPGAFVVGCMSRLQRRKRNDVLIDAVLALAADAEAAPVHLIIAGEGDTKAELQARAAPLGAAAHFLPTPGDRAAAVLSAADVAVFCPSPTEGAPLAVVVAMLVERAVVASAAEGAEGLIVPGTGAIASPEHDPAAVASLLRVYRDDPERRLADGARARRHAASLHSPDKLAAQLEQLFGLDAG